MTKAHPESPVDALAAQVGMPIPADCRPGVLENFARMEQMARLFLDFPLPAEIEAAPVFRP